MAGAGWLSLIEKTIDVWTLLHPRDQAEVQDQRAVVVILMAVEYPEQLTDF